METASYSFMTREDGDFRAPFRASSKCAAQSCIVQINLNLNYRSYYLRALNECSQREENVGNAVLALVKCRPDFMDLLSVGFVTDCLIASVAMNES